LQETKAILDERLAHVERLLRDKRPVLDRIAARLLEQEVIDGEAFERMGHYEAPEASTQAA
jgi:ATP-dependent Zn protease